MYELGKGVYRGELINRDAVDILANNHSMNKTSARYFLTAFRAMMSGERYTCETSVLTTEYFLENIRNDFGDEQLKKTLGAVQKHVDYISEYRKKKSKGKSRNKIQEVVDKFSRLLKKDFVSLNDLRKEFDEQVARSSVEASKSEAARLARDNRLNRADKMPQKKQVTAEVFSRNPDVVAKVLERAEGICERCKKPAPFIKYKDKKPYLEVHHKIPLAKGGADTVKNAVALCPNCHRYLHYGVKP